MFTTPCRTKNERAQVLQEGPGDTQALEYQVPGEKETHFTNHFFRVQKKKRKSQRKTKIILILPS